MAAVGTIIETQVGDDMVYTDETGASFILPGYAVKRGMGIELDPRIDLTQPIYEQAAKLDAEDRSADRKRQATAA